MTTAPEFTDTTPEPDETEPTPAPEPTDDVRPKRPTTRAGRRAAAQAKRAAAGQAKADKKPAAPRPRKGNLQNRLSSSLCTIGMMTAGVGAGTRSPAVQADGAAVIANSEAIAEALARLADEDPKIKAALERMLAAGAWSGVIAAVAPLVLAIMANHGMVPAQLVAMLSTPAPPAQPEPAAA